MLNINFLGLALPDKAQKFVKFSFLSFSADIFLNFLLKTCGTLKMFLLSAQNNLYIKLSSYVKDYVKSEFHVSSWFPCLQNLDIIWKTYCRASFEIIFRRK